MLRWRCMDIIQARYENMIRNGVIYAQVRPRIEMLRHLDLDVRSQEEVRVAASIILMYQCDEMLCHGMSIHYITPFQASHAVRPRKINGHLPHADTDLYAAPHLVPKDQRPVLDELISRGWEQYLQEEGYIFNRSDGLAYGIGEPEEDCPIVFDPVILAVERPTDKHNSVHNDSEQRAWFAFEKLEDRLTGGFGLLMKRF